MNNLGHERWTSAAVCAAALAVCTVMAAAQDLRRILPEVEAAPVGSLDLPGAPAADEVEGADELLMERLQAIDLSDEQGDPVSPPKRHALQHELAQRLGEPLMLGGLVEIVDLVVAHYQNHGVPAVEVMVPEQEITGGRIELIVVAGRVGDVALAGGAFLNKTKLGRGVRSKAGDALTTGDLYADLDWLNRNRFHDARLTVAPGAGLAEADLLFTLSDARPLRVFAGFENSGVDVVGEERWLAGFDWGNAFGLGHRLVYQATVGADVDAFRAHAVDYRAPLPWRHELGFQAAISKSAVDLDGGIATEGSSWLLGAAYTVPLPRAFGGDLRHEVALGFEWKSTDNNLEFGGAEVFASTADIGQFTARYSGLLERGAATTSFAGSLLYSPGDLGDDNTDAAFSSIRADAVSEYAIVRGALNHTLRFAGGAAIMVRAGGQWTDAPLLPSEQYSLGGHDMVRGYGERDGLGDLGYFGSLEVRAPSFAAIPGLDDRWQLLGFIDYGRSWAKGGHGADSDRELAAAGPGLRYRIADRASLRADYGRKLDGDGSRAHIGLRVEF